jgi:hypothetical protein
MEAAVAGGLEAPAAGDGREAAVALATAAAALATAAADDDTVMALEVDAELDELGATA